MLEEALILACRKDRDSLLNQVKPHTTSQDQKLYLISTYQPNWGGLKDLVTRNWDFLTRTKFLHKKKVIFGYRCNKNLKDILMHEKVQYPPKPKKTHHRPVAHLNPCTTTTCRYCPRLNTSGHIISTYTNRSYSTKARVDCKSGNLIYCIACKTCKIQYVGQTKRRLMDRFQGYFYNIASKSTKDTIGQHFNQLDHHGIDDIEIHIVDFSKPSSNQCE